jgi:hypothetical protein
MEEEDFLVELDDETAAMLATVLGRGPDEDGIFTITAEEFEGIFNSDLNEL